MSAPSVLITGAGGYIGKWCVREFLARSWRVFAMVHRSVPPEISGAQIIRGDLGDADSLCRVFDQTGPLDAVVNSAAHASDMGPSTLFRRVNFTGAVRLAQMAKRRGVKRFVQVSTTDVYGLKDFYNAGENTPLRNNLSHPYPRYKIFAEIELRKIFPDNRCVMLRPGVVWGGDGGTVVRKMLAFLRTSPAIIHFGKWRGRNRWSLTHVRNTAGAAFLAAAAKDVLMEYNIVDPSPVTVDEFFRMLAATFLPNRRNIRSMTIPFALGWAISWTSQILPHIFGSHHPLIEPSVYGLYSVACNLDFNCDRLKELFAANGQSFVSVADGLAEMKEIISSAGE